MKKKRKVVAQKRSKQGKTAQGRTAQGRTAQGRTAKTQAIGRLRASADQGELADMGSQWQGYYRPIKKPVTLRLDADILAWFKKQGRGYQTRINRALRKVMVEGRKS